jgi:hypothetical protein
MFTRNIREVFLVLGGGVPFVQKLYVNPAAAAAAAAAWHNHHRDGALANCARYGMLLPGARRRYAMTKLPFTPFLGPVLMPLTTVLGQPLLFDPLATTAGVAQAVQEALTKMMLAGSVRGAGG